MELFDTYPKEFQDLSTDDTQLKFSDSRKTRLTLLQINRLRKMTDMRNLEKEKDLKIVQDMYATPPAEGGGMPGL
jgi:hypothetical protein